MQTSAYKTPVSEDMPTWISKFPASVREVVVKAHLAAIEEDNNIRLSPGSTDIFAVVSSQLYHAYYVSRKLSFKMNFLSHLDFQDFETHICAETFTWKLPTKWL